MSLFREKSVTNWPYPLVLSLVLIALQWIANNERGNKPRNKRRNKPDFSGTNEKSVTFLATGRLILSPCFVISLEME